MSFRSNTRPAARKPTSAYPRFDWELRNAAREAEDAAKRDELLHGPVSQEALSSQPDPAGHEADYADHEAALFAKSKELKRRRGHARRTVSAMHGSDELPWFVEGSTVQFAATPRDHSKVEIDIPALRPLTGPARMRGARGRRD